MTAVSNTVAWAALIAGTGIITAALMLPALIDGRRNDAAHQRLEGDQQ